MFTYQPLLRYLKATPTVHDYVGEMYSATDRALTMVRQPKTNGEFSEHELAHHVIDLLNVPLMQRLHSPAPIPIDHPGVVVIVDHPDSSQVLEYGAATVRAVQMFLNDLLYLPVDLLEPEMVRAPYFDGEQFDSVSYYEVIDAVSQHEYLTPIKARWRIENLLRFAVYEVDASQLIAREAIAELPYS